MIDVVMPQMGESITEGTLTKWLKKPGDRVEQDEPLFEISTDKVDTEVPSPAAGILAEVLVSEGQTVAINTVVARIDETASARPTPSAAPAKQAAAPVEVPTPAEVATAAPAETPATPPAPPEAPMEKEAPEQLAEIGPVSPLVRRLAREHQIDLREVKGTGPGGRITKQDIEAYLAARAAQKAAAPATPTMPAPPPPATQEVPAPAVAEAPKVRIEPMSLMRTKIAEHMVYSKRTSAHVTTVHRVDMTRIARLREQIKEEFKARYGFSLTYLPFIVRAAAQALRAFPIMNASIDGNNIVYHNEINIGIAVALDEGLIVPVIRHADEKSIIGLQRDIVDLATRARARKLKPEEVQGGTFSITNYGSFGSLIATPIIPQPQVAILGVGAVTKEPVVIDDAIAIRSVCYLSLTFDHRLIDGAPADQFVTKIKQILENWNEQVL